LKIEDFRRRNGYLSNSRAVTALVERGDVAEDIEIDLVKESRQTLIEESTSIITKIACQIFSDILKNSDKPLSDLKFDEIIEIIRSVETKEITAIPQ